MRLSGNSERPALIDGDNDVSVSYDQLFELVNARVRRLGLESNYDANGKARSGELVFLSFLPTIDAIVDYLAVRAVGAPVVLLDPRTSTETINGLADRYQPTLVLRSPVPPLGYSAVNNSFDVFRPTHAVPSVDLGDTDGSNVALLLPTSATTGNPKMVQLSEDNLNHNARAIVDALGISENERGLACLPLFYSFGLSVLNSHLEAGATTVLTGLSPVQAGFWGLMGRHRVTSVPAVPYSFQMFKRVGMLEMKLPHLRYVCQAGGRVSPETVGEFHRFLDVTGKKMFLMYGQTEATARMSVLPSEEVTEHGGSVGYALSDGSFRIDSPDANGVGEIMYSGPNVMLGYAESREDVGVRSVDGELATGDLGHVNDGGRLTVTGRISRVAKVFGHRVDLDDVERILGLDTESAAVAGHERIHVFVEDPNLRPTSWQHRSPVIGRRHRSVADDDSATARARKVVAELERRLEVPPRTVVVKALAKLPTTASGKIDYQGLTEVVN